jgi:hypothetical protein
MRLVVVGALVRNSESDGSAENNEAGRDVGRGPYPLVTPARAEYLARRIVEILRQDGPWLFAGSRANVLESLPLEQDISGANDGIEREGGHHPDRAALSVAPEAQCLSHRGDLP